MRMRRLGFSLLEVIVGVAIATAFLGAIAMFTANLGDARARLARASREIECADEIFTALERACASAGVDGGALGSGIDGNESSVRIVRAAVGLGNDGQPPFSGLSATTVEFSSGAQRVTVSRGEPGGALAAPVRTMRLRYLAEDGWQDAFDSADAASFPVGIELSIWFARQGDATTDAEARDPESVTNTIEAPPDRTRFFRVAGAPQVDPLAIRKLEDDAKSPPPTTPRGSRP